VTQVKKDVTDALEDAKGKLDEALRGLETLSEIDPSTVAYSAHELENYLTVAGAAADLLLVATAGYADEQVKRWIEGIQHVVQLMAHSVHRLNLSTDTTGAKFTYLKVDMGLLVFRACNFYQRKAEWKKIQVITDLAPDRFFAKTDPVAVAAVMDNLLSNAFKFSASGKRIWVSVQNIDEQIVCTVRDEGPGFMPEDMPRLFTKGARLSNQPTGGERSLGYGLAISRDLIEQVGGAIACKSVPGEGASFYFTLPVYKGQE
jgi:signal transduction histidine kinase